MLHIAIDDELQVVSDARPRCVDAVLVGDACHEIGCGVYAVAVRERGRVEIAVDGWADRVVIVNVGAVCHKAVAPSVGRRLAVAADGVQVDKACGVAVANVFRHGKGEGKLSCSNTVVACIDGLASVVEGEGRFGTFRLVGIVHTAGYQFACIAHRDVGNAVKALVALNMSFDGGYAARLQHLGLAGRGCHTVNLVNHHGA